MLTELKHYVSRISRDSYWHCGLDNHGSLEVSAKDNLYIKMRIKGVRDQYDKDLIVFSRQGKKEFSLKGKGLQVVSFIAMLIIFLTVMNCPSES
jgi:hypothetical protein